MNNKIIPFPGSSEAMLRLSSQAEREQHKLELILSVRTAAKDPKRKFDRDNEIGPAQAIDKLIHDAKERKITQLDIRDALPKLHLERLRIAHQLSPSEAKKNA